MLGRKQSWRILVGAFTAMLLAAACGGGDGVTSVDVRLDWLAQGPNSGFFVARGRRGDRFRAGRGLRRRG